MSGNPVPDSSVDANQRVVSDTIGVAVTSGGRIALSVELANGEYWTTYLTPDEWHGFVAVGDAAAKVIELTKERDYWRTTTDDPGLYWNDPNPPYRLPHDEALIERAMPGPERVSPAEYLADTMRWRGWMIDDLAVRTHLHPRVIEEVINNGRPITPRIAGRLALVLGTSPDLWLDLQRAYDDAGNPGNMDKEGP